MFELNEYWVATVLCLSILGLWITAFCFAEIWRHVWMWMDDQEKPSDNLVSIWLRSHSDYKYPIYRDGELKSYVKDAKYKGMPWHSVPIEAEGDPSCIANFKTVFISSFAPMVLLLGYKIYFIVLIVGVLVIIALLARFTRRLSKSYKLHVNDKNIHIQ